MLVADGDADAVAVGVQGGVVVGGEVHPTCKLDDDCVRTYACHALQLRY